MHVPRKKMKECANEVYEEEISTQLYLVKLCFRSVFICLVRENHGLKETAQEALALIKGACSEELKEIIKEMEIMLKHVN